MSAYKKGDRGQEFRRAQREPEGGGVSSKRAGKRLSRGGPREADGREWKAAEDRYHHKGERSREEKGGL